MIPWRSLPWLLALTPALALAEVPEPCGNTARQVANIAAGLPGSSPAELVRGNRVLFFSADDGASGREPWRSSGTGGAGTFQVKDVQPGLVGGDPRDFTVVGNKLFFSADDGVHGRELWVSDGTPSGTHMVKDINAGVANGLPVPSAFPLTDPPTHLMAESNGVLYFTADDGSHGRELWRSDGTALGTFLVEDLNPGALSSSPRRFMNVGSTFYFVANVGRDVHLRRWGLLGSTSVFDAVEDNVIFRLTPVKSRLFFLVDNDEGEASLWKTDGTASSTQHLRFFHGEYPHDLVALGKRLVFAAGGEARSGAEGEPEGSELWVSDGTEDGTRLLKDIRSGPEGSAPGALAVVGSRVYFAADDGEGAGRELWVSNGTEGGTVLFKDLQPGPGASSPESLAGIQSTLFFSADTVGNGREPWVSNGTAAGTHQLDGIAPGGASSTPRSFIVSGWDVFFTADDGGTGRELWALPFKPADACR
ncbi:hypothetical protein P2318_06640 [Myxococcaceae bacterium GXIMD 01537]